VTGTPATPAPATYASLWESLLPIGRDPGTGGYRRYSWTPADLECRAWFAAAARDRELRLDPDRNGNLWAWWDAPVAGEAGRAGGVFPPSRRSAGSGESSPRASSAGEAAGAVATGSHLDSVPDGGAYDGPLGVVSAFAAIDELRAGGFVPARPIAVAAFAEEEGARFGVACLGSRLLTGAIDPDRARALEDGDGITLAGAMQAAGQDPRPIGRDEDLLGRLGCYVELHIEQGRALADLDAAVGIAEGIWPHGRWRLDFAGQADHAGTAALADRRDPMIPYAATVLAARQAAVERGARATIGKVTAEPGAANAVCSAVHAWLDVRAPDGPALEAMVDQILAVAGQESDANRVVLTARQESFSPEVEFDLPLADRLAAALAARGIEAPSLPTGAGHDAGVLAARLPTAMLFVRNPTGVSHSPAEHAGDTDCAAGVTALAAVLRDLAG
jgi:N-carbamoyl-L-amino-acid hydrolase